jgi:hypothetical protein
MRILVRLMPEADEFLRGAIVSLRKGIFAERLAEAIDGVDIDKVEIFGGRRQAYWTTVGSTVISIEPAYYKRLQGAAEQLDCSLNALVNAILLEYKSKKKKWKDAGNR